MSATKRGHSVTWLLMWPKRAAAYKGCMYLNNSSLQLCSPSCLFPAESAGWAIHTAAWLPHLQPRAPTCTVKGLNLQLKSRNSSLVLPLSDSIRAGLPGEAEVLPWMHLLVAWKADSCSAPHSGLCSEPAWCQLLCRVALELRGLCRRSRPTGLEPYGGFWNGLIGSLGSADLVFPLDSSKMAQRAQCCSEGRSCVEDKQRLQLPAAPREGGRRLSFQQPLLSLGKEFLALF